jgi:hypothetical protein
MLRLADIRKEKADFAGEAMWLERSFALGLRTSRAAERLAPRFEEQGRWEDALKAWKAMPGGDMCGNCIMAIENRRKRRIVRCLRHLGRPREAAEILAASLVNPWADGISSNRGLQEDLYDLYRDAGQIEDLRAAIDAIEKERRSRMGEKDADAERRSRLGHLRAFLEDGDPTADAETETLVAILTRKGDHTRAIETDWVDGRCEEAARILARRGGEAVPLLRAAAQGARYGRGTRCLLFALAISEAPEALDALHQRATRMMMHPSRDLLYAIGMKGKAGRKVLEQIAEKASGEAGSLAREILHHAEKGNLAGRSPPPPPKGSLPREIELPPRKSRREK